MKNLEQAGRVSTLVQSFRNSPHTENHKVDAAFNWSPNRSTDARTHTASHAPIETRHSLPSSKTPRTLRNSAASLHTRRASGQSSEPLNHTASSRRTQTHSRTLLDPSEAQAGSIAREVLSDLAVRDVAALKTHLVDAETKIRLLEVEHVLLQEVCMCVRAHACVRLSLLGTGHVLHELVWEWSSVSLCKHACVRCSNRLGMHRSGMLVFARA